jgi:ribosomal-protein-alanine N-acetyltransferase
MQRHAIPAEMLLLKTNHLLLEPQTAAHAAEMFEVLSDPAIYEFENGPPESLAWLEERYRRLESRRSADGHELWLNWVVRSVEPGDALGYVQATVYADANALIAYEFGSAHWGRGWAREAVEAMLDEIARAHGVTTAGAVFKKANFRSRRLLQRLGFGPVAGDAFPCPLAGVDEDAMAKPLGPA